MTVFMGPIATQMLGALGADVVKVEAPGDDSTRTQHLAATGFFM